MTSSGVFGDVGELIAFRLISLGRNRCTHDPVAAAGAILGRSSIDLSWQTHARTISLPGTDGEMSRLASAARSCPRTK
jgi:hypothetical protein